MSSELSNQDVSEQDLEELFRNLEGDREAVKRLVPLVYQELRRMAHLQLGWEGKRRMLNTTALVHEAYLKLEAQGGSAGKTGRTSLASRRGRCAAS